MSYSALSPEQLYHRCDLQALVFDTTDELAGSDGLIGQQRATDAIRFGVALPHDGYNLYVSGNYGSGRRQLIRQLIAERGAVAAELYDWCYINNFDKPDEPILLHLPVGRGSELKKDMEVLVALLLDAAPAAFKSDEYRKQIAEIQEEFQEREERALSELADRARLEDVALIRTPNGYTLGPMANNQLLGPKEFDALPEAERQRIQGNVEKYNDELRSTLEQVPRLMEESRQRVRDLNQEFARITIEPLIADRQQRWLEFDTVRAYLEQIFAYVIENFADFLHDGDQGGFVSSKTRLQEPAFQPYAVNLLVDNRTATGAPIYFEDNPTYQNLLGRIEHVSHYGSLITNFTLIKAGALHKANGGYLIVDARKLLLTPFAWEGLKRALLKKAVTMESVEDFLSFTTTTALAPQPMPLAVKVVLYGPRLIYYLLQQYDPEFALLFKVHADFSEDITRDADSNAICAQLLAAIIKREQLLAFSRAAIASVIEYASRLAEDGEKMSLNIAALTDVLREADHWARRRETNNVDSVDVQAAIDARERRSGQLRERVQEAILRGTILIDTDGDVVGQVNGLSVLDIGDSRFGMPTRITATARLGGGKLIDIERETELGGAIHSKGVLILSSFLSRRYARDIPLAVSASLVFEQSYGRVEGDSASAAELCALLSAIAELPIRQQLAVTGSVNQRGQIQAIGGVNEKIEGFFAICAARGLSGQQGVIIPASNCQHLMLNAAVRNAVAERKFAIYSVSAIDDVMTLLTGLAAGEADGTGNYPADSCNGRVQRQLQAFAQLARRFVHDDHEDGKRHEGASGSGPI